MLLSVNDALMLMRENSLDLAKNKKENLEYEELSIDRVFQKTLAEDIWADRDQPPFDRVMMDGIAIKFKSDSTLREFKSLGLVLPGVPQKEIVDYFSCYEVMTGAVLPDGASKVIPYEEIEEISENHFRLKSETELSKLADYIHKKGSDYQENQLLIKRGAFIHSPLISLLASVGKNNIKVQKTSPQPHIFILSTGDELIENEKNLIPQIHQIRWSSGITLQSELLSFGINPSHIKIQKVGDDELLIKEIIKEKLNDNFTDLILVTGGISAGKSDFVKKVLGELAVKEFFHGVKQRPGKPLWFGGIKNIKQKFVFGLPGNPVSSLVNVRRFVLPFIFPEKNHFRWIQGDKIVMEKFINKISEGWVHYLPVSINTKNQNEIGEIFSGNGSGDFYHLKNSTGFIEVEKNFESHPHFFKYFPWGEWG
jgi:molybdopterin molybdotransferase